MNHPSELFQRPTGDYWIVFVAAGDQIEGLLPALQQKVTDLENAGLLLVTSPESLRSSPNALTEDIETLLNPGWVEAIELSQIETFQLDRPLGFLVLAGGPAANWIEVADRLSQWKRSEQFRHLKAVLLIEAACEASGEWRIGSQEQFFLPGLAWFKAGLVLPGIPHPAEFEAVRQHLLEYPRSYALGLPPGTIMALGPQGELEMWSDKHPSIVLGKGWSEDES